jgi:hypothetical protein
MWKRFVDGLVFGAGFGIAFTVSSMVVSALVFPVFLGSQMSDFPDTEIVFPDDGDDDSSAFYPSEDGAPFHTLPIEEKIAKASAIALVRYEPADDGRMKAVIVEYLKLQPGTEIFYAVGDEYSNSSFYPQKDRNRSDGEVIFFTGSPASMRFSTSVDGDRITGLNDIPTALFREKCNES